MRSFLFIAMMLVTAGCDPKDAPPSSTGGGGGGGAAPARRPAPVAAAPGAAAASMVNLTISYTPEGMSTAKVIVRIEGDTATVTAASETQLFNLRGMSWFNAKTGEWVTLKKCEEWAARNKEAALRTIHTLPPGREAHVRWYLDPTFDIKQSPDGTLRLTSGQVDFLIEGVASKTGVDGYYRYALLDIYKRAMNQKSLSPYPDLKALAVMKTLGYIPRRVHTNNPDEPPFDMEIAEFKPGDKPDGGDGGGGGDGARK